MLVFDPQNYGVKLAGLLAPDRLCELGPGQPNQHARPLLDQLSIQDISPSEVEPAMAGCCLAALWLWHNYLDISHDISQEIPSQEGSYWHAIMHRREPDYSNAKYWFRRVGDHQIFPDLQEFVRRQAGHHDLEGDALELAHAATWDPFSFVDVCESVARGKSNAETYCRELARYEWQRLFHVCYERATN